MKSNTFSVRALGKSGDTLDSEKLKMISENIQVDYSDIALIGLGPAGSTLARLLSHCFSIAAIDKKASCSKDCSKDEKGFSKVCGGLLSPDAQKVLSRFSLTLPSEILVSPQIFSVRTLDLNAKITRFYQRFYLNMDRNRFDQWLISLIPKSVKLYCSWVSVGIFKIEKDEAAAFKGKKYITLFKRENEIKAVASNFVIGSDGANSIVRRSFFNNPIRQYISIQQWFENEAYPAEYLSVFDETITDSYAWSCSKDGFTLFGAALPLEKGRKGFEQLKQKLCREGFSFLENPVVKTEACLVNIPSSLKEISLSDNEGVFLLGEAAGFISPSSLEGISYGFFTALELARAFLKAKDNSSFTPQTISRLYRKNTRTLRLKLFEKLLKSIVLYTPFLRRLVMKSGITAIDILDI